MKLLDIKIHSLSELPGLDLGKYGIKGLIFDYGGTIDTGGEHWSDVIRRGYESAGINIPYEIYWDAYVYAERELGASPHILPDDTFLELMRKKIALQFRQLTIDNGQLRMDNSLRRKDAMLISQFFAGQSGKADESIVNSLQDKVAKPMSPLSIVHCQLSIVNCLYAAARECVAEAKPVLEELANRYPMVIVSNFYGNLNAVLEDFGIRHCFRAVIESAVVGVRKPDPEIFRLGIQALNLPPYQIATIGDSLKKDILPSRSLGTNTIQLTNKH